MDAAVYQWSSGVAKDQDECAETVKGIMTELFHEKT
jgi:hypothetical protein